MDRIHASSKSGLLTSQEAKAAHELRRSGNDVLHGVAGAQELTAERALRVLQQLLTVLFAA
jgi:hypothetical protein